MNLKKLLNAFMTKGIQLVRSGNGIELYSPLPGQITEEIIAAAKAHKSQLMQVLDEWAAREVDWRFEAQSADVSAKNGPNLHQESPAKGATLVQDVKHALLPLNNDHAKDHCATLDGCVDRPSEEDLDAINAFVDRAIQEEQAGLQKFKPRPLGKNPLYALLDDGTMVEFPSFHDLPRRAIYWCRKSDPRWTLVPRLAHLLGATNEENNPMGGQ